MTKKRWFRLYIDQWFSGTTGLNPNEIAAYITVLCELYDHDGSIIRPDFDIMARRCGMRPTSFRKAFDALTRRGKLTFEGDLLTSKAVSAEIISREKLDQKSEESRRKRAEKEKEINEMRRNVPSNKEYRIQNSTSTTSKVVGAETSQGGGASRPLSPAVQGFISRTAQRQRRGTC